MWNKYKDNPNHSPSLMLLYCWIRPTSMGKVSLCTPTESRIEWGMSSHYWISKANKRRELVFATGIAPSEIRRSECARVERTKRVERETHSLFGHTPARSRLKSRISFLGKCSTSSLPSKSCPSQRMEGKTGGEDTCRLSQPVRGSSHGAW